MLQKELQMIRAYNKKKMKCCNFDIIKKEQYSVNTILIDYK